MTLPSLLNRLHAKFHQSARLLCALALIFLLPATSASAAGKLFNQQEFDTLLADGKTVVVHIHAEWCGTCKAQDVQVNAAMNSPDFAQIAFLEVNFDVQRKAVKSLGAKVQSTLIIFRGGREIDRTVAARDPAELQAFLKQALQ